MITGYNTDVKHNDVVFHVQTEDKGVSNPCIESLIYVRGQVLASKRSGYAELLAAGKGEKEILAMMDHQHRVIVAAIKGGKFDDRLGPLLSRAGATDATQSRTLAGGPEGALAAAALAAPAAAAVSEAERSLDQVILEYLTNEAEQDQLTLAMDQETRLAMGSRVGVVLTASSSKSGQPVAGAQVTVKMISTATQPRTLGSGQTDARGRLALQLEIPRVEKGVAALVITAASAIGNAELKHLL